MLLSYLTSGKRLTCVFVVFFAAASTSCNSSVSGTDQRVASIVLEPESLALTPGGARAITATVLDEIGATLPNIGIHWSSENPQVATVSAQGIVSAVGVGKTQVAASKSGKSTTASISVSALPPALVRVTPTTSSVLVGGRVTLTADVFDAGGGILTGYPVAWSSSTPTIASVNGRGIVTGVASGNVVIGATAAGLTGTAVVTVQPVPVATVTVTPTTGTVSVGASLQLSVSLLDAAGRLLTGRPVTWSSADQNTATVSGNGLVRGRAKGSTTITTTSEGKTASATIIVP
ncbi:MAG: Ig-like domain-containing protein [Gemmatimonadaceae bacterium]